MVLAKDMAREIGVPLEVIESPEVRQDAFDSFWMRNSKLGGVKFTRSTQILEIAGEPITATEWIKERGRVDALLLHEGIVKKAPEPAKQGQRSTFLDINVDAIIKMKEGKIRQLPFWLRWLIKGIII